MTITPETMLNLPLALMISLVVVIVGLAWKLRGKIADLRTKDVCNQRHRELTELLTGMQRDMGEIKGELRRINGGDGRD